MRAAVRGAHHSGHTQVAKQATESDVVIVQFQRVIELYLQDNIQGLIKQPAFDGVVVVLQKGSHQVMRLLKLL